MIWRFNLTTIWLLLGTLLHADSLATLTVTVAPLKDTRTVFEVYERNKYDRIIARAECGDEVSLAPDRYNVRIIEESKRGLREIWQYNIEATGTVRLKAKFGPPTVRIQILDNPSISVPRTIVFKSTRKHRPSYSLPLNTYTRIPTGTYTVNVISGNKVVSSTLITLERELDGTLKDDLTIEWVTK
jgi:hypothetical protein